MNSYKIFQNSFMTYEAVKQGWSWPAFFFGLFWAIAKRIWWLAGLFILASIILQPIIADMIKDMPLQEATIKVNNFSMVLTTVVGIILGVYGNKFREQNLISRGYIHVATITAENPKQAIEQYLAGKQSNQSHITM